MSELIDAMITHIYYLVHDEQRPFSYLDFMKFEVNGREFKMSHGTFRNKISCLMKEGLVEVSYKSHITFYTLKGVEFGKASRMAITGDHHMVVTPHTTQQLGSNPVYRIIKDLPLDKNSVHDIRLNFRVPDIYHVIVFQTTQSLCNDYTVTPVSKDISLSLWQIENLNVKVVIHKTDTVSIIVGCSYSPVAVDVTGIIRLTNALAVVRERLSSLVSQQCIRNSSNITRIPDYMGWIVSMWHFGADASVEYTGERFSATWGIAQDAIIRVYTKTMKDHKTRIRLEKQEYPRTTLALALEQKLDHNHSWWSGGE
ncbi:MAG: hypothetical protein ACRD8W_06445 [Nitrososphaeraceae archaeon]